MSSPATVGVVVVSYRSPERTCAFVREELSKLPFAWEVCVVDVASTHETRAAFEAGLPHNAHRIFAEENLGYSRGNNRGAQLLREKCSSLKYLLLCNDDVLFDRNAHLERLTEFLDLHSECAVVGPDVRGQDGAPQSPWNTSEDLGSSEHFRYAGRKRCEPFGGLRRECYAVRGCLFLVRADLFFQVGGFDEEYFLFFEEPVLSTRLRQAGFQTWYLPESRITHLGSATIKKALSSWRIYRLYRKSFLLTARKYWGWSRWHCMTWPLRHLLAKFL